VLDVYHPSNAANVSTLYICLVNAGNLITAPFPAVSGKTRPFVEGIHHLPLGHTTALSA
jgi:hypothetical protein